MVAAVTSDDWEETWRRTIALIKDFREPRGGIFGISLQEDDELWDSQLELREWLWNVSCAMRSKGIFYGLDPSNPDISALTQMFSEGHSPDEALAEIQKTIGAGLRLFAYTWEQREEWFTRDIADSLKAYSNHIALTVPELESAALFLRLMQWLAPYRDVEGSFIVPVTDQPQFLGDFLTLWIGSGVQSRALLLGEAQHNYQARLDTRDSLEDFDEESIRLHDEGF